MLANELMIAQARIISSKTNEKRIEVGFEIGEPVWLYCYFRKSTDEDERISKLPYKWHGPFRIVAKISNNVYEIDIANGSKKSKILVNVNRLKKYQGFWSRPDEDVNIDEEDNEENNILNDLELAERLPRESFISQTDRIGTDEVIINSEGVVDKVIDKRIIKRNGKKITEYFLLLKNGSYIWRNLTLSNFREHVDNYENNVRSWNRKDSLRRSSRVKDLDFEAGHSRTYFD